MYSLAQLEDTVLWKGIQEEKVAIFVVVGDFGLCSLSASELSVVGEGKSRDSRRCKILTVAARR